MDAATLGAKLPRDAGETLDRVWFRLEGNQVETDKGVEPLGARVEDNYDGGSRIARHRRGERACGDAHR